MTSRATPTSIKKQQVDIIDQLASTLAVFLKKGRIGTVTKIFGFPRNDHYHDNLTFFFLRNDYLYRHLLQKRGETINMINHMPHTKSGVFLTMIGRHDEEKQLQAY
jgi:hypothetical protein